MKRAFVVVALLVALAPLALALPQLDVPDDQGRAPPAATHSAVSPRTSPATAAPHSHAPAAPAPKHGLDWSLYPEGLVTAPPVPGPAPIWMPAETSAAPGNYRVKFSCPLDQSASSGLEEIDTSLCPVRLHDPLDIMSQPELVIDPQRVDLGGFHALHGGHGIALPPPGGVGYPSAYARDNDLHEPHTLWAYGGNGWLDQPYFAPDSLTSLDSKIYGMDNAITQDGDGRVVLATQYAILTPEDTDWRHLVVLHKLDRLNMQPNYLEGFIIYAEPGYNITGLDLNYAPETDLLVASWLEYRNAEEGEGPASYIAVHTSPAGQGTQWDPLPVAQRVGPCRSITNSVAFEAALYFGCFPDVGFSAPNATFASPDLLQMFAFDTVSMSHVYRGIAPFTEGRVILIPQGPGGHQILIASGITDNGDSFVQVSYGALGLNWNNPTDYGAEIRIIGTGNNRPDLVDGWVTAAAYTEQTSYIHVIWMEKYAVDPNAVTAAQEERYNKTYAVIRPIKGYEGQFNLQYSTIDHPLEVSPAHSGLDGAVFEDRHDSIVTWIDPRTGKERLFTAFGDMGFVRFGEVVEVEFGPVIILPPTTAPLLPVAATSAATSSAPAIAGALFGLMALRLLAARRKLAVVAPA